MKKLIVIVISIAVVFLILSKLYSSNREVIWTCPKGEEISYIKTAEEPGKLFVVTQKGDSWILRAVYGPDRAEVITSGLGNTLPWKNMIQGYESDEFLLASSSRETRRLYIHNSRTRKETDIKGVKNVYFEELHQPFSPDGKWLALNCFTLDKGGHPGVNIVNRQSGKVALLPGIDSMNSNYITWTLNGLFVFNTEKGLLYRGNKKGVKPIRREQQSRLGYVTPDGNELMTIRYVKNNGILLNDYNIKNNDSKTIYAKYPKLTAEEMNSMVIWQAIQFSPYSNEMTVYMNWLPIRPIYVDKNRVCKEIPIGRSGRLWYLIHGVAIWKPGVVAYVEDSGKGKRPVTILSVKMK